MKKLSLSLSGHKTSISIEKEFIDLLKKISIEENKSISSIVNLIDNNRKPDSNLSSEVRIWILNKLMNKSKL